MRDIFLLFYIYFPFVLASTGGKLYISKIYDSLNHSGTFSNAYYPEKYGETGFPGGRREANTFVYQDRMYLFGGFIGIHPTDPINHHANDLWSTTDLKNWIWVNGCRLPNSEGSYVSYSNNYLIEGYPMNRKSAVTFVIGNKIFIFSGYKDSNLGSSGYLNDCFVSRDGGHKWYWIFGSDKSSVDGEFTVYDAPAIPGRRYGSSVWVVDGVAYVFGGWADWWASFGFINMIHSTKDCINWKWVGGSWRLRDPGTYTSYRSLGGFPSARRYQSSLIIGDYLYIFGGFMTGGLMNDIFSINIHDFSSNGSYAKWFWVNGCNIPEIPTRKNGNYSNYVDYDDIYNYTIVRASFNYPNGRYGASVGVINDTGFIIGGNCLDWTPPSLFPAQHSNDIWASLNFTDLLWIDGSDVPDNGVGTNYTLTSRDHAATWNYHNKIYIFGDFFHALTFRIPYIKLGGWTGTSNNDPTKGGIFLSDAYVIEYIIPEEEVVKKISAFFWIFLPFSFFSVIFIILKPSLFRISSSGHDVTYLFLSIIAFIDTCADILFLFVVFSSNLLFFFIFLSLILISQILNYAFLKKWARVTYTKSSQMQLWIKNTPFLSFIFTFSVINIRMILLIKTGLFANFIDLFSAPLFETSRSISIHLMIIFNTIYYFLPNFFLICYFSFFYVSLYDWNVFLFLIFSIKLISLIFEIGRVILILWISGGHSIISPHKTLIYGVYRTIKQKNAPHIISEIECSTNSSIMEPSNSPQTSSITPHTSSISPHTSGISLHTDTSSSSHDNIDSTSTHS